MNKYKCVIFDLDGTIADTKQGIINGFRFAAKEMGFKYLDKHENDIIGPSLHDSFSGFYKLSDKDSNKAVNLYREYYREKGLFEYVLYNGIKQLLMDLKKHDIFIALATTKYRVFAELMIKKSEIYKFFDFIVGSNADGTLSDKKDLLEYVLINTNCDSSNCVMVGDRFYDALGAQQTRMEFIWAEYGYGEEEEFNGIKIDYTACTVKDIYNIVIN